jgi:hypothetical protein
LIDLPPKGKASFDLVLTADACTPVAAFSELFVEVTGSNANDANTKAWRETFFVDDTRTFTERDWTNVDDNLYWNKQIVELGTRADAENCCLWLIFAYWKECKGCWEKASTAGELWTISFFYCTGCLRSNPDSDILPWQSPRDWTEAMHAACSCFDERTLESSAFHSNLWIVVWSFIRSLVGSQDGKQLGSFIGLLINASNQIRWFSRAWFMNASPKLAERKIASSTKNFERAVIAVQPFAF